MSILSPEEMTQFEEDLNSASALKSIGTQVPVSESGLLTPVIEGTITAAKQDTVDGKKSVSAITVSSKSYKPDYFYTLVEIPKRKFDGGGEDLKRWLLEKSAEQIAAELDNAAFALLDNAVDSVSYDEAAFKESVKEAMKVAKQTDGFLFDSLLEGDALGSVTNSSNVEEKANVTRLFGRNAVFVPGLTGEDSNTVGYAGKFKDNLIYGIVPGSYEILISTTGTANNRSALERNLVFARVEVLAFVALVDDEKIVKFVTGPGGGGDSDLTTYEIGLTGTQITETGLTSEVYKDYLSGEEEVEERSTTVKVTVYDESDAVLFTSNVMVTMDARADINVPAELLNDSLMSGLYLTLEVDDDLGDIDYQVWPQTLRFGDSLSQNVLPDETFEEYFIRVNA